MMGMSGGANVGVTLGLTDNMSKALMTAEGNLQKSAQKMQQMGSQLRMAGVAMTGVGVAGLYASNQLMQGAASVEQGYAKVNTMLGEGQDAYAMYNDQINKLVTTMPIMGGELAATDAMYQVLSAGVDAGADSLYVLETAMKASIGGMTDTSTAVDVITTALNAYQLPASDAGKISDLLFTVVKNGKTDFEGLAAAVGPVVAIAAAAGVGFDDVSAAMATMTKGGIQVDQAGTALRATLTQLLSPSEALDTAIKSLGHESGTAMLETLGFQGTLEALAGSVGGNTEGLAELFPNVRALTAVLPLTGAMAEEAAADLEAMAESTGNAEDAYGKMADTTASKLTKLENRLEAAKIAMADGTTPAMLEMKEAEVQAMEALGELNEVTHGAVGATLAYGSMIMTAMGPIVAIIGQYYLMKAAKLQIAAANATETATTGTAAAARTGHSGVLGINTTAIWANTVAMLANPVFVIALVIALVVIALIALYQNWDKVTEAVGAFNDGPGADVMEFFGALPGVIFEAGEKAMGEFLDAFGVSEDDLEDSWGDFIGWFDDLPTEMVTWAQDAMTSFLANLGMDAGDLADAFDISGAFEDMIDDAYDWGYDLVMEWVDGILAGIDAGLDQIEDGLDDVVDFFSGKSPPPKGPLHTIDVGGYNTMLAWGEGMQRAAPALAEIAGSVAYGASSSIGNQYNIGSISVRSGEQFRTEGAGRYVAGLLEDYEL